MRAAERLAHTVAQGGRPWAAALLSVLTQPVLQGCSPTPYSSTCTWVHLPECGWALPFGPVGAYFLKRLPTLMLRTPTPTFSPAKWEEELLCGSAEPLAQINSWPPVMINDRIVQLLQKNKSCGEERPADYI